MSFFCYTTLGVGVGAPRIKGTRAAGLDALAPHNALLSNNRYVSWNYFRRQADGRGDQSRQA